MDSSALTTSNTVNHSYVDINPFSTSNPYAPYIRTKHRLDSSSPWCEVDVLFPGIFVGTGCGSTRTVSNLLSAGLLPATQLTGKTLYVLGNLEVDASYIFDNCNIIMSTGGRIIVKSGAQLTLRNNTLVDAMSLALCKYLWNGIEVMSGGTLYTNDATIQNAYFAIQPIKDNLALPDLHLESTTLRRNFIGVYAGSGNFTLSWFRNNTFEGANNTALYGLGTCNPPVSLPGAAYSQRTYCGIYFSATSGAQLLMPTLSNNNLFTDLQVGILAVNGTTSIRGCRFNNIRFLSGITALYQGTAIAFIDGSGGKHLTLYGLGKSGPATIDNCERGVFAYSAQPFTEILVANCQMLEVTNGIDLDERGTGNFSSVIIQNNYIGCTLYLTNIKTSTTAVEIKDPNLAYSYFLISRNDIDLDQPETYPVSPVPYTGGVYINSTIVPVGIHITSLVTLSSINVMQVDVTSNLINLIAGHYGIIIDDVSGANIADNQLYNSNYRFELAFSSPILGISVKGGFGNIISCNVISDIISSLTIAVGIFVDGSPLFVINQNTTSDMSTGITVNNDNSTSSVVSYNDFTLGDGSNYPNGLYYYQALTGPQYLQGNDWVGDLDQGAALYESGAGSYTYCNSRYYVSLGANVKNSLNPVNLVTSTSMQPCGDWFEVIENDEDDYVCGDSTSENLAIRKNEADINLAEGGTSELNEGYKWTAEMGLYQKFTEHPYLIDGDEVITSFLDAVGEQPVVEMYNTRKEINSISVIGFSLAANIENTVAQLKDNEINMIDLLDQMQTGTEASSEFANLSIQSETLEQQLTYYLSESVEEIMVKGSNTSELNSSIECNTVPCTLEKYINNLYIETQVINPRDMTLDELEVIKDIALQCPAEAGVAPYLAQAWYYLQTGERLRNSCSSFLPDGPASEERKSEQKRLNTYQVISLLPNPAVNDVTLYSSDLHGGMYFIKDVWGRVLLQQEIIGETTLISLADFTNGTYFVYAKNDAGIVVSVKKLMVLH